MYVVSPRSSFTSSISVQRSAVLWRGWGDIFSGNVLKIETWKPICQVDVCRRRHSGYRDTTLGCGDFCPNRMITVGRTPGS